MRDDDPTVVLADAAADELALMPAVFALRALMLAGERFRQSVAEHFDVGMSETVAMNHLSMSGALTPRQLADRLGLTPSTVTALLDRLEDAGLATRSPHPTDRRRLVVAITSSGVAMLVQVQEWIRSAMGALDRDRLLEASATLVELSSGLAGQATAIRAQTVARADRSAG